jgi:hypothetical protein
MLAYTILSYEKINMTPAKSVFDRQLRLPCDLLLGAPVNKEQSKTDYVVDHADWLRDIKRHGRQHLKVATEQKKARYHHLATSAIFQKEA